ncbi:hypothetical protein [Brachybacterium saurashtrense]|uniref:Uncharacterized protein n=1 Tax=Brachybacterium saurashtrense TaxID=556288 RepID=A0A345YS84_9MICO|nr:hypothetical protein [Brachybacterium saurashtrense]AXK46786.1 hypothetical protein DWV08_14990 [Brachybacterium saurashtrense]RRR22501.1 hypothetical protein DXU92_09610 [Brachybacterium saurashtrense]
MDSPPDTAFTVNDLAWTRTTLSHTDASVRESLPSTVIDDLDHLLDAVTPALRHGGVHTPNHRWEISSALCRLWEVHGDRSCLDRAEQWLGEGVDLQRDGLFSERSANYAAHVSVPSLLTMGRILERPELIRDADIATRRQAELTDARGFVETLASRRQDQFAPFDGGALHPWFRAHAARTGDPLTARAAHRTAARADADALLTFLAHTAEEPEAATPSDAPAPDPTPTSPEVVSLDESGLVTIDHGSTSTVLFGGTDTAALGRITSGSSSRPVLARFRGREVGIRELRLSRDFFSLGPMRPGPPVEVPGPRSGEHRYLLEERVQGEYFHPLPRPERDADGRYALEFNGRFAAAMDFSRRPADAVRLDTSLQATSRPGELELTWTFDGAAAPQCLLLALDGVRNAPALRRDAQGRHVLEPSESGQDTSRARCVLEGASERVEITASGALGGRAFYDPGEGYTFLGATDEPEGDVLLIPASSSAPLTVRLRVLGDR